MAEKSEMESFELEPDEDFSGIDPDGVATISLRFDGGLKYREIADLLGCALGTVRSRINRAKHAILENRRKAEGEPHERDD